MIIHTRETRLTIHSDECFEELSVGTLRRFIADCDAARIDGVQPVTIRHFGDCLIRLEVSVSDYEELPAPAAAREATDA